MFLKLARKDRVAIVLGVLLLLLGTPAFAADEKKEPAWYEYATGVIAIPAAFLGIAYSYVLIKKTRLESLKLEADLKLSQESETNRSPIVAIGSTVPSVRTRLLVQIVLRYLLLVLLQDFWGLLQSGYGFAMGAVAYLFMEVFATDETNTGVFIIYSALNFLPTLVRWLIFLALGWPLFKEINSILGIDIKASLLSPFARGKERFRLRWRHQL